MKNNNDSKKTITDIFNDNKSANSGDKQEFEYNNGFTVDDNIIAGEFNKYFVEIGKKFAQNLSGNNNKNNARNTQKYKTCTSKTSKCIFLNPVTSTEVISSIGSLKMSGSSGWDELKSEIIKYVADVIAAPLSYIINLSFATGTFPDELKIAKVCPIFKSDKRSLFTNYRPISILSTISKFFEKLMYNRIYDFLDKNYLLFAHQFGFRSKFSTELALAKFTELAVNNINKHNQ
jgi:hypothetical protein